MQLRLALRCPFSHKSLGTRRKMPVQYVQPVDFHQRFIFSVKRVKVRRRMVIEIHPYNDSVEPADLRHVKS